MAIKRKHDQTLPDTFTLQPATTRGSDTAAPCAVYFANGFDPAGDIALSWTLQRNSAGQNMVVAATDGADFVGTSTTASGPAACRYAVGVLDHKKRVLTYAPLDSNALVRLEVKLHTATAQVEQKIESVLHASPAEKREAHNRLVNMFGSQRAKRDLVARQAAYVSPEALGNTDAIKGLLQAAGDRAAAAGATRDEVMAQAAAARNIPPHHPEATSAFDAYRLLELLPQDRAVATKSVDKLSTNDEYRSRAIERRWVCKPVLDRLGKLPGEPGEARTRLLQCLTMLSGLLNLLAMPSHLSAFLRPGQLSSVDVLSRQASVEPDLLRFLLDKFYEFSHGEDKKDHFSLSAANKALMTMHALVFALIADGFVIGPAEFEALRNHLKLQPVQLAKYFRELGCNAKPVGKLGGTGSSQQQFRVVLLPHTDPPKTLAQCLPSLQKAGKAQRGR